MKYGRLSLGQIEALVNKIGGMEAVEKILRGELVVRIKEVIKNFFHLEVNYNASIEELIREGKYDWVNDRITDQNFLIDKRNVKKKIKIVLFRFNKTMTSEEVIVEMEKVNCRPAEIHEFLSFGINNPEEQSMGPIVGLGSPCYDSHGVLGTPFFDTGAVGRTLCLDRFDYYNMRWDARYRFLAVSR